MHPHKEILKQAGIYTLGSQAAQIITLVTSILSRRFLGPAQMGIWATLQILIEYAKYSSLGTFFSVAREIPYLQGKGETTAANQTKNIVFTASLSGSSAMGIGILIFAALTRGRFAPEVTGGLFFMAGIIVLQRLSDLLVSLLRCYKLFHIASSQMIASAFVNGVLVAFLTYFFKIYGFIWAQGLSLVFNILFIRFHHNFHFKFQFDRQRFVSIVSFGLPLMLIGILTTFLRSVDKLLLAKMLGFEAVGYYSIAFLVTGYIGSAANSANIVLVPHLQEKFARTDNPSDLIGFLSKAAHAFSLTTPAVIGTAWTLGPFFITLLLPKFVPGIEAMKFLSLSTIFLALTQPYSDFLITIKKHYTLFPLLAATGVVAVLLDILVIRAGYGINGVALATTLTSLLNFATTYFVAARYLANKGNSCRDFFIFMAEAGYIGAALILLDHFRPSAPGTLFLALSQFALFAALYVPMLFILNKQFAIFAFIREKRVSQTYASHE